MYKNQQNQQRLPTPQLDAVVLGLGHEDEKGHQSTAVRSLRLCADTQQNIIQKLSKEQIVVASSLHWIRRACRNLTYSALPRY